MSSRAWTGTTPASYWALTTTTNYTVERKPPMPHPQGMVFLEQPPNSLPSIGGTLSLHIAAESVVLPRAVPWTAALLGALGNC